MAYVNGYEGEWEYVIGLEVHAQISSKAKLFSGASTEFGAATNTQVSLFDAALPGVLPVLNGYCVEQAVKTGLALNADINKYSLFDRKNYFYPDLPNGYQISQFYHPIVSNGFLNIKLENGEVKSIKINRLHMEQDAGKSIHDQSDDSTLIDLNRAGIALMEIVTDPVIASPYEAAEYIKNLRNILRCIGTCDGDMEKGSLRCDANVSVRRTGGELGTRCEIKNLNSTKNIMKAIEFEAIRQIELLENGETIIQETRLFDADKGITRTMRLKSDSVDYRYFPDPDLLPVLISEEFIENIKQNLPELPVAKIQRYISNFDLNEYDAEQLVGDEKIEQYFEQGAKLTKAKPLANWITSELFGLLNKNSIKFEDNKISFTMLAQMINSIEQGVISGKMAKEIFATMFETGEDPNVIIEKKGLSQLSDETALKAIIDQVLAENEESVQAYHNGKDKLFGFFVGAIMKESKGRANPTIVNALLKEKLAK